MAASAGSFLPRFANAETLKHISAPVLLAFFDSFWQYFARRGYDLPKEASVAIDYQALVAILIDPDREVPPDLAQRLYLVHEMPTEGTALTVLCVVGTAANSARSRDIRDELDY